MGRRRGRFVGRRREIGQVSCERIREELTRILTEGGARRGFELLYELGLLAEVLPEVVKLRGVEQPPEFHPEGDVWVHTMMLLEKLPFAGAPVTPTLAWGALLHDIGKPATFQHAAGGSDSVQWACGGGGSDCGGDSGAAAVFE